MIEQWWLSNGSLSVSVRTLHDRIIAAPPEIKRFIGQPLDNLTFWMNRNGTLEIKKIV